MVATGEFPPDGSPALRIGDDHETPRLAVADRRRQGRERQERVQDLDLDRLDTKTADVAPPAEQRFELVAESGVKPRRHRRG